MIRKLILIIFIVLGIFCGTIVYASPTVLEELYLWSFDAATIKKGYTVSTPDELFNVGVLPDVLIGETDVTIKVFNHSEFKTREIYQVNTSAIEEVSRIQVDWPLPKGMQIVSPIYEFDIKGASTLYDPSKPLWLRLHFNDSSLTNKAVYYWDKGKKSWTEIPADLDVQDSAFKSAIHLTYAPMAVLASEIPVEGEASWYSYHGCNCAASRHYPHGTLLEVTDLRSNKSVIVEVNDYGPEEWTGRIIDLDLVAFEQISEKWRGLTQVRVEPYILTEEQFTEGAPQLFVD